MPVYQINDHSIGIQIGIWQIQEGFEALNEMALGYGVNTNECLEYRSRQRRLQWLAVRLLLVEMLKTQNPVIYYDSFGKPHLKNFDQNVSISHSGLMVAVILNEKESTGIDIEKFSPQIERIQHKFLAQEEQEMLLNEKRKEDLLKIWSTKEAIYKAYGKNSLSFKENINIKSIDDQKSRIEAEVVKGSFQKKYNLEYQKLEDYMMVYVLNS